MMYKVDWLCSLVVVCFFGCFFFCIRFQFPAVCALIQVHSWPVLWN